MQHEWKSEKSDEVKSIVSAIIGKERNRDLPNGYHLIGVMLSSSEPRAMCVWEAASKSDLEGLLNSVNPPTKHSVTEYQVLFGVSKVS